MQALEKSSEEIVQRLNASEGKRATEDTYGAAKIARSEDVTVDDGLVLGASEKNPAVDGSIAKKIEEIKNTAGTKLIDTNDYGGVILFANSVSAKKGFYPISTSGGVNSNNVPGNSYGYSTGFVISRGTGTVIIVVFNRGDGADNEIAVVNANYGGNGWRGWRYIKSS